VGRRKEKANNPNKQTMILKKLSEARQAIRASKIKKAGHNTFSKYDYFTPEQINQLVNEAEKVAGLIHFFNMKRSEHGLHGYLDIIEIETGEKLEFIQATEIPSITATNIAQQIGGAVTYTNRYMLMTAFDLSNNSLDFDSQDNSKPEKPQGKKVMPDERFQNLIGAIKKDTANAAALLKQTRDYYTFTQEQEKTLADWEAAI
jgi:hypothetical protein